MTDPGQLAFIHPDWNAPESVRALCTTRSGGNSKGPWSEFNLADHVGDLPEHVKANRALLYKVLELPAEPLWLSQVHGCEIAKSETFEIGVECDASVTFGSGAVCVVLTADCLPILFCSKKGDRVAAAHAGWRGLAAGVIENTIKELGGNESELMVWLGPAIGPDVFEVGEEVYDAFVSIDGAYKKAFTPSRDKWLCDIYGLAREKLSGLGVDSVWGGGRCTYSEDRYFYSYRRDGVTGRMASLIWIE